MPKVLIAVVAFAIALSLIASCQSAYGADCRQFFYKQQVVAVAPVVAYPHVYYQAGVGVEQDALAAKVAKLVIGQLRAELKTAPQQQTSKQSAIARHCAKCHSGAAPKAGIVLDGVTSLACSQITSSLRAIASEEMPKDHKLTPEQKGAVMQELLNLEADRSRSVDVLPPEPTGEIK